MAAEPVQEWSEEQLKSDSLQKKDIIRFLQENAADSVRCGCLVAYAAFFRLYSKQNARCHMRLRFKGSDSTESAVSKMKEVKIDDKTKEATQEEAVHEGPPKYKKSILKKGDKVNFPKKGDTVSCWYKGTLEDGTVFDSNIATSSKKKKATKPLSFKVGVGKVIRGWDEALLTMSKGEKALLEIDSEWAYGKKGNPEAKYPLCSYNVGTGLGFSLWKPYSFVL
ncbi:FKBP3 isomerase, partial [Polypterus senegalus]